MNRSRKTYTHLQIVSAIFMILALLWLTASLPFVYSAQQQLSKLEKIADAASSLNGADEKSANPFGNNTEEKAAGTNSSLAEEFLHDHHPDYHFFSIALSYHKVSNAGTYIAFHGELLVPPPNQA